MKICLLLPAYNEANAIGDDIAATAKADGLIPGVLS